MEWKLSRISRARAISWSYRLPDDGHFCVDFTCPAPWESLIPFPKLQRKRCCVRTRGWPLFRSATPPCFLSMDSSLISAAPRRFSAWK